MTTRGEALEAALDHAPAFGAPVGPWHRWFAWFPVVTWDGRLTWLATVRRRRIQKLTHLSGPPLSWWEYERRDGYEILEGRP